MRIPHDGIALLTYLCLVCAIASLCIEEDVLAVAYVSLSIGMAILHDMNTLRARIRRLEEKVDGED